MTKSELTAMREMLMHNASLIKNDGFNVILIPKASASLKVLKSPISTQVRVS